MHGSSLGLAIVQAAAEHDGPLIVVASSAQRSRVLDAEIDFYLSAQPGITKLHFPDWECLPYDTFSPHSDIISARLRTLSLLPQSQNTIVTLSLTNLLQRLPPVDYVLGHSFQLSKGEQLDVDALKTRLARAAYQNVSQVMSPGEFAIRGGLIDIFPMGATQPFRLDLFGDEIESIRYFDPESQRSTANTDNVSLLPAREFPMTEEGIKTFRQAFRQRFDGDPQKHLMYRELSKSNPPAGTEFFFPLFFAATATLFDYVADNACWILDADFADATATFSADTQDRFENANFDRERRPLAPQHLYLGAGELKTKLANSKRAFIGKEPEARHIRFDTDAADNLVINPKAEQPFAPLVKRLQQTGKKTLLVADTAGRREALINLLVEHDLLPTQVASWQAFMVDNSLNFAITVAELERGMELTNPAISVITEAQIYGERVRQNRKRSEKSRDPDAIIRSLAELKQGDPVVHNEHGVGRYIGLQTLGINGEESEFLMLEYLHGDKLYVPVLSLHLIGRYVGGSADTAPLHKLGTDTWGKIKQRAQKKARDAAAELLEIEALRNARPGIAYKLPEPDYSLFTAQFPFDETPDQAQAIEEVLGDMQSAQPMDRLVCGDVGFGKTEVALRAAFVAVQNKKQVAMLVPTTLLAQQHLQSFQDRFADQPVIVELMSRFKSKKENEEIVKQLKNGSPDIIVGTHRLLQPDVKFKDLGLLIIDEEHRFGVRQKEQIKRLRSQVDILTLTATPIPRTLNLAMSGLRPVSIIATPPKARLAVKTFVRPFNNGLIREACMREIRRGGQVYFLHNQVRTIGRMQEALQQLLPEASIEIAHGQMPELQLEKVMRDFYHQRFNILLCSTIIESGIDVPSANTIIVNKADKFGLAQMHQLRGRVGRSHHQAFAYFMLQDKALLTADASKRLDAIESLEDLGAGFQLASHDLEIRGAGELLGEIQSGSIDAVGFTLYAEYLSRAVASLKQQRDTGNMQALPETSAANALEHIELHMPALFPSDYLPDVHSRLVLYKRVANAKSDDALHELQVEIIDRFGLLPEPAKNLFRLTALRLAAERLGVKKIDVGPAGGRIEFLETTPVDPGKIISIIQNAPKDFALADSHVLRLTQSLEDTEDRVLAVENLIDALAVAA